MNDLELYHDLKARIDELEKVNRLLLKNNSKWKRKYEKLRGIPTTRETRTSRATVYVQAWIDGDRSLTFRQIADKFYLSRETIKNISYKLRHKNDGK
tara:strand:- start:427 stop:717 length:291 start_codon:yes stop_codon:yes gene_type:complete